MTQRIIGAMHKRYTKPSYCYTNRYFIILRLLVGASNCTEGDNHSWIQTKLISAAARWWDRYMLKLFRGTEVSCTMTKVCMVNAADTAERLQSRMQDAIQVLSISNDHFLLHVQLEYFSQTLWHYGTNLVYILSQLKPDFLPWPCTVFSHRPTLHSLY